MWRWTWRSLVREPAALVASVSGVAVAFLLALALDAIFAGEADRIVAYPARTDADVWVMQEGVANMHMATSMLHMDRADDVRGVPGVERVTPILYLNTFVRAGGEDWFTYAVGLPADAATGLPWSVVAGRDRPGPGELLLSDVVARKAGVAVGDRVAVGELELEVVGLTGESFSMANTVTWLSREDLSSLMSAPSSASYLLVTVREGVAPTAVAARIEAARPDLNAMTGLDFVASDRRMAMHMGADVVRVMTLVGTALAGLVLAFTVYASTLRRGRELAVAKALGATDRQLLVAVLLQSALVGVAGWILAICVTAGLAALLPSIAPEVSLVLLPGSALRLGGWAAGIVCIAALVPTGRVLRIDPALAFSS